MSYTGRVFVSGISLAGVVVFSIVVATLLVAVSPGTGSWRRWVMLVVAGIIGGGIGVVFFFVVWAVASTPTGELERVWAPPALIGLVVVAQLIGLIVGAEKYFGRRGERDGRGQGASGHADNCPECRRPVSQQADCCPHCGAGVSQYARQHEPAEQEATTPPARQYDRKWSNWAIAGVTLGLVGLLYLPVLGGIAGILCSVVAINKGDKRHGKHGLWISVGSTALWVIYYVVAVLDRIRGL